MTLEELLNKLIEKGWKPRWEEEIKNCQIGEDFYERKFIGDTVWFYEDDRWTPQWLFTKSLRELVSKESGLWQFCIKKGIVDGMQCRNERNKYYEFEMADDVYTGKGYEYRLIESALKDESELEQFLLQNIKVWNGQL